MNAATVAKEDATTEGRARCVNRADQGEKRAVERAGETLNFKKSIPFGRGARMDPRGFETLFEANLAQGRRRRRTG
jgi:hypothetical protein